MSDGREQSYYEIALTNRQVMSVFVVLLVCLLIAFVSGVWIGKEGRGPVQTVAAQSISSGVSEGEPPLGEMDFFDESGEGETPDAPAAEVAPPAEIAAAVNPPAKRPERTGRKRRGGKPKNPRPAAPGPEASGTPTAPPPEPAVVAKDRKPVAETVEDPGAGAAEEPAPEVTAALTELFGEPSTPRAQEPPRAAAVETGGSPSGTVAEFFFIQVFSSTDERQATSVVDRLRRGSYPAILSSADVEGRVMYRVRIGPYDQRDMAAQVARRVQTEYKLSTWITR